MDDAQLLPIRRKVEAGEALTDEELSSLRAAVANVGVGTPTLRLTLAHALINARAERAALPILEALTRDFPNDLQSWLGLARAQMMLDRREDARRSLEAALRVSPDDPEALKVLAVIALQRSEHDRARALIDRVLELDPLDEEAQLVKGELERPGEAPPLKAPGASGVAREVALRPQFTEALVEALKSRRATVRTEDDVLWVRPEGAEVARVSLASLHAGYLSEGRGLEEAVSSIADGLIAAALGLPADRAALLSRILPVLRPRQFAQVARGAAYSEGPAGLLIFYVLEDPELVRYVPRGSLDARGLTVDEVKRAAFENLERSKAPVRRVRVSSGQLIAVPHGSRVHAVAAEDGHDGARLLTVGQREVLAREVGPGPWRVNLGRREAALVCREADADASAELASAGAEQDGIAGQFRLTTEGLLEAVHPHG